MVTLPTYSRLTGITAAFLYFAILLLYLFQTNGLAALTAGFHSAIENPIAFVVAHLLGAFSSVVLYLYLIWSLTFIPFIGFQAYKASQEFQPDLITSGARWLQLYGAILLPCFIFAIAWSSTPALTAGDMVKAFSITLPYQALGALGFAAVTILTLFVIHRQIPKRLTTVRLSLLSILLYTSVYFTYNRGIGVIAFGLVFGSLIYIMFWSHHFTDLLRQITMYDVEPKQVEEYDEIIRLHNETRMIRDQSTLIKEKHSAEMDKMGFDLERARHVGDHELNKQLVDIRDRKSSLNKQINSVQIELMDKKIKMLNELFSSVSKEMAARVDATIPKRLEEVKENLKSMSPDEINAQMTVLMQEIDLCMKGMPEKLDELRVTLLSTTKQLEEQTRSLVEARTSGDGHQETEKNSEPALPKGSRSAKKQATDQ